MEEWIDILLKSNTTTGEKLNLLAGFLHRRLNDPLIALRADRRCGNCRFFSRWGPEQSHVGDCQATWDKDYKRFSISMDYFCMGHRRDEDGR